MRVIAEKWDGGHVIEQTAFKQTLRPSEMIGQHIELRYAPLGWPPNLDLAKEADPTAKLRSVAMDQHEWLPMLVINGKQNYKGSVNDTGVVNDNPDLDPTKKAGKSAGGAAASAADLFGDPAPAAATATGQLTAEWLEYELRTPGQPTQVLRRQIFDLLGPAARAAGSNIPDPKINDAQRLARSFSLLGRVEILPLTCQLSPDYVSHLMTVNGLGMRDALTKLNTATDAATIQTAGTAMDNAPAMPGRLYGVALTRVTMNPHAGEVSLNRLNVLSEHTFIRDGGAKGLVMCDGIDIVANGMVARPDLPPELGRRNLPWAFSTPMPRHC